MEKFFYYGNGFRAWFVLQHLWGYKPFLTKITFKRVFKGNLNIGLNEIKAEEEQRKKEEFNKRIQQDIWSGPKF